MGETEGRVILYEGGCAGDRVSVECRFSPQGIAVERVATGSMARWCLGDDARRGVAVPQSELGPVLDHFGVEDASQLAGAFRVKYACEDALERIEELLEGVGVHPVAAGCDTVRK